MEFNVNVNVKLSLDSESMKLALMLFKGVGSYVEEPSIQRVKRKKEKPTATDPSDTAIPATTDSDARALSTEQTVNEPAQAEDTASDLPFDEAESEQLPFVAIWMPEDARKARKKRMEAIEATVPADIKDEVHKQMVKVTKLYLNSAAYEHKRDDMGNALNTDGLPVKKLDELNSNETLRFMYLCEAMHYDEGTQKVLPFEKLDDVLASCANWEEVERDFVKTYNKK